MSLVVGSSSLISGREGLPVGAGRDGGLDRGALRAEPDDVVVLLDRGAGRRATRSAAAPAGAGSGVNWASTARERRVAAAAHARRGGTRRRPRWPRRRRRRPAPRPRRWLAAVISSRSSWVIAGTASRIAASCIAATTVCASDAARGAERADAGEPAGRGLDQAAALEPGQRLADRGAADARARRPARPR